MSRRAVLVIAVPLLAIGTLMVVHLLIVQPLIEAAYHGRTIPSVDSFVARHRASQPDYRTLDYYQWAARVVTTRITLVALGLYLAVTAWVARRRLRHFFTAFFKQADDPLNLALTRITVFWILFSTSLLDQAVVFASFPPELRRPPVGMEWLGAVLPIDVQVVTVAAWLLRASCFLAIIGFATRPSALVATVLAFYVLGIPQMYGKVSHYHHMVWFAAILSLSRCSDVLSIDALWKAVKRADRGELGPPRPMSAYGVPLRMIWLLLGVIYFFAGFWKLWTSGIDWALSDNLRFMLYTKWLVDLDGWTPAFRIDQYPWLYRSAALGTMAFELSFVVLVFFRPTRWLAVGGGVSFHSMISMFMGITFLRGMLGGYVALVDWRRLLGWVGRRLFPAPLVVLYDGQCPLCRRTIACLRTIDVLGRMAYVDGGDRATLDRHGLGHLDPVALATDLYAVVGTRQRAGFAAYRMMAWRLPLLWPLLPLLYLPPVPQISRAVYRRIADSRHCQIGYAELVESWPPIAPAGPARSVALLGAGLLTINIAFGFARIGAGWPFALYPTFAGMFVHPRPANTTTLVVRTAEGRESAIGTRTFSRMSHDKVMALKGQIFEARTEADRCRRAAWIWAILEQQASLSGARALLVYRDTLSLLPENWARNPLQRELLLELPIRDNGTAEPEACIAVAQRSGHSTEPDDPDRPRLP